GIRDGHVTGVQTCALPIYLPNRSETPAGCCAFSGDVRAQRAPSLGLPRECCSNAVPPRCWLPSSFAAGLRRVACWLRPRVSKCRSEERRVGKVCILLWSRY